MVGQTNRSLDCRLELGPRTNPENQHVIAEVELLTVHQLLERFDAETIALFKMDIEGSERDVFENVADEDLKRVSKFVIEYHDNLRPGTLNLLRSRLSATHDLTVKPTIENFCGLLYAIRKNR